MERYRAVEAFTVLATRCGYDNPASTRSQNGPDWTERRPSVRTIIVCVLRDVAWLSTLLLIGCLIEANPNFGGRSSTSSGMPATSVSTASTSTNSSTATTESAQDTSASGSTSAPGPATGSSDTGETEPTPVELSATIVDLGPANSQPAPQLAWAGGELGVSWDVHRQFVRLDAHGEQIGLAESIIDYDAKDPDLGTIDGDFLAAFANFNSEILLRRREATDTWTSLGRQDAAEDSIVPSIATDGSQIYLAWREDVLNVRVAQSDVSGTVVASELRELGSSHVPQRTMVMPDAVFTLIKQDQGERLLLEHSRDLVFVQMGLLNDGPVDVTWNPEGTPFTFAASRNGALVLGQFDGLAIQGELLLLDPDPGSVDGVRIAGAPGRYLVAWRASDGDGTHVLNIGRLVDDEPFETLVLDEDAGALTDLVLDDSRTAIGWAGPEGPRVAFVTW